MKLRNIVAAAGAVGIMLSGCGGGSPRPTETPTTLPTSTPLPVATPTPACEINDIYVGDVPFEAENFKGFIGEKPSPEYIEAVLKYNKFLIEAGYEGSVYTHIRNYFINKGLQIPEVPTTLGGWPAIIGFDQEFNRLYASFLNKDGGYSIAYFPEELECPTQDKTFTQGLYDIWHAYRNYTPQDSKTKSYFLMPSGEGIGETSNNYGANVATFIPVAIQNQQ